MPYRILAGACRIFCYRSSSKSWQRALAISIGCLCVGIVAAEETAAIVVDSQRVDMGDQPAGSELEHDFKVTNQGGQDLELRFISKSCSCTTSLVTSKNVAPGASTTVKVGYTPEENSRRVGEHRFSVVLGTNDPKNPQLQLEVVAKLRMPAWVVPERLEFGKVSPGTTATLEFAVYAEHDLPALKMPTGPEIDSGVTLTMQGSEKRDGQSITHFSVQLDPNVAASSGRSLLRIGTGLGQVSYLEVPVEFEIAYCVQAEPSKLLVGLIEGSDTNRKFEVKLTGSESCFSRLGKVISPHKNVIGTVQVNADGERILTVSMSGPLPPGRVASEVQILDQAGLRLLCVPILGFVRH